MQLRKPFVTYLTGVGRLSRVGPPMAVQIRPARERLVTELADIPPVGVMRARVHLQVIPAGELPATLPARVRLPPVVRAHVQVEARGELERLVTHLAEKRLLAHVCALVVVERSLAVK